MTGIEWPRFLPVASGRNRPLAVLRLSRKRTLKVGCFHIWARQHHVGVSVRGYCHYKAPESDHTPGHQPIAHKSESRHRQDMPLHWVPYAQRKAYLPQRDSDRSELRRRLNVNQTNCLVRINCWNEPGGLVLCDPLPSQHYVGVPTPGFHQHKRHTCYSITPAARAGSFLVFTISFNDRRRFTTNQASHELLILALPNPPAER